MILGIIYGASIAVAITEARKPTKPLSKISVFLGRMYLGLLSLGIYPITKMSREQLPDKQAP